MRRRHKHKRDRTLLCNVFNNPKSSFNKRPTKPGVHAGKLYSNTHHGELLFCKQRLLAYYCNMKDYQLKTLVYNAIKYHDYKQRIVKQLESRLDVILYRSGCVKSMREARQLINHRNVFVARDNQINLVSSPSYNIDRDAIITFRNSAIARLKANQEVNVREVPKHITFDINELKILVQQEYIPNVEKATDLNNMNLDSIVSYYRF